MAGGERNQLLTAVGTRLAPGGMLVVHSVGRHAWEADDAPVRGRPRPGRPLRPETWCQPARAEHGYDASGQAGPDGRRLPGHRRPGRPCPVRARPARGERRRARARRWPSISSSPPSTRTTPRGPTRCCCATCCARRGLALGDLRRGDPRRPGRRGLQALDVPRARGGTGDVPSTSSRPRRRWRGFLAEHAEPLILDFHNFTGPEHFAGWEPHTVDRAARAADELALLGAAGDAGAGRQPVQRARAPPRRLPAHRGGPGPGRLRAGDGRGPTRGWRPSWPAPGGRAEPTSSSSAGSCRPRPSTSWSRRCGPTGGSTTRGPPAPGGGHLELRVHQGAARLRRRPRADRRRADRRRRVGRGAGGLLRRGRRLPLALGPRGVRRAARRGDGGRRARRRPAASARWPRRSATPRSLLAAGDPSYVAAALHRVCTDDALRATLVGRAGGGVPPSSEASGGPARGRRRRGGGPPGAPR